MGSKLETVGGLGGFMFGRGEWAYVPGGAQAHGGGWGVKSGGCTPTSMLELKARFTLALMLTTCPTLKNRKRRKRVGVTRTYGCPAHAPELSSSPLRCHGFPPRSHSITAQRLLR